MSTRGLTENLVYLNTPNSVADSSGAKGTIYSRPAVATLAPIYTPQVPIVRADSAPSVISAPAILIPASLAPSSSSPNLAFVVLVALLIVLVLWLAKIMFRK
jgi:hypothetical protein